MDSTHPVQIALGLGNRTGIAVDRCINSSQFFWVEHATHPLSVIRPRLRLYNSQKEAQNKSNPDHNFKLKLHVRLVITDDDAREDPGFISRASLPDERNIGAATVIVNRIGTGPLPWVEIGPSLLSSKPGPWRSAEKVSGGWILSSTPRSQYDQASTLAKVDSLRVTCILLEIPETETKSTDISMTISKSEIPRLLTCGL